MTGRYNLFEFCEVKSFGESPDGIGNYLKENSIPYIIQTELKVGMVLITYKVSAEPDSILFLTLKFPNVRIEKLG
jgi:hypothetical protein